MSEENNTLPFDLDAVKNAFKGVKHWSDLTKDGGPFQLMFKSTIESLMKAELEEHLGYKEGDVRSKRTDNCRNGSYSKTIKSKAGDIQLEQLDSKMVLDFLSDIEKKRGNSPSTRNSRIAAIKAFMKFVVFKIPSSIEQVRQIQCPCPTTGQLSKNRGNLP